MSVLEIKDMSYKYDGTKVNVLENISLKFEKGNIYTVVGMSGSGKTTLLSVISGLASPTSGQIVVNNRNIAKIDKYKYRSNDVGVIFQGYNLLPQLTAIENVVLSLDISKKKIKDKKKTAMRYLESVRLDESKAKRRVLKLSGGEQQRVAIARALSYDPDIILADEPTGNLDSDTEKSIMDILKTLAKEQDKCVIIVTHSESVAAYGDEKIVISNGKIANS